jgi:hypothetical protein
VLPAGALAVVVDAVLVDELGVDVAGRLAALVVVVIGRFGGTVVFFGEVVFSVVCFELLDSTWVSVSATRSCAGAPFEALPSSFSMVSERAV